MSTQITEMVSEIPEFEYRKDLNKWIEIMQASIKNHGHYSEHLIEKKFQNVVSFFIKHIIAHIISCLLIICSNINMILKMF